MASRSPSIYDGMLVRVLLFQFKRALALVLGLAGLLLVAWTVDWVCVAYVWPGRVEGLRDLLAEEMAAGMALATRQGGTVASLLAPADWLCALIFDTTGWHKMGQRFAEAGALSIPDTVVRDAWIARRDMIEVAMLGTQLLGLRTGIMVRILPLEALLYALGVAEGLHQRAIRRAQMERESASRYHRGKLRFFAALVLGTAAILIWPNPVAWSLCPLLGGVGLATLSSEHWKHYKKHI